MVAIRRNGYRVIRLHTHERITDMWKVQTGKGKSRYETRYTLSSLSQAEFFFSCLNIHSGYKKRLISPDGTIVARYISQ